MTPPHSAGSSSVRRAYDTIAEVYAELLPDTRAEAPLDLAMVDAFASAVGSLPDPRVLDAGCAGRMTRYLADRGCAVEGVDLSPRMIDMARRDHEDLVFRVGSLTDLPYPDGQFAGVMLWYSIIHTAPDARGRLFAEAARVLAPCGTVLVGFQSGSGVRDVSSAYAKFGEDIQLVLYLTDADLVVSQLQDVGLHEVCRLVRRPRGRERDDHAFVIASR